MIDDARKMKKPCRYCGSLVRWEGVFSDASDLYALTLRTREASCTAWVGGKWVSSFCSRTCAALQCEENLGL